MIIVYDKFVKRYIGKEHIGSSPSVIAHMLNTNSYRDHIQKVARVTEDLNRNNSDPNHLIPYLVKQYGLSLNEARDFVHKNIKHRWRKADSTERKCMVIHSNRGLEKSMRNLEEGLFQIKEN